MTENPTRRSFYSIAINVLGALITTAMALPAAAYLLIQRAREQGDDTVEIGDADRFETGKPEEVVYFRTRLDGWKRSKEKTTAWVVKMDPQHIIAFSPQCTHLGCAYHWEAKDKNFACPCHASAFSMEGKVLAGPAPRPLDRFVTRIEGGKLLITSDIERA